MVKVITDMIQKGGGGLSMVRSLILLARLKFLLMFPASLCTLLKSCMHSVLLMGGGKGGGVECVVINSKSS